MVKTSAPKSPYEKQSYSEDMVIKAFDTPFRKKWMVLGLLFLVGFPFLASEYAVHLANHIAIACIAALALNLLCGNAGLLSLGQAGFLAAGAFTAGIMTYEFGMPFWVVFPASIVVGAILGLIAGLPSLKLKGIYLGLSSLALHFIIVTAVNEYQFHAGFSYGITIKAPQIGSFALSTDIRWYFFLLAVVWGVSIFITNLLRSQVGRAWIAIHNRDIAAEVIGINIGYQKISAFIVSTSIVSLAGCLWAYYTNVASIDEYDFMLTIKYLAMIIIGGMGSVLGSLMGAFLITLLPYLLMYLFDLFEITGVLKDYFFAVQSGLFGVVMIFFLLIEPLGLAEIWRRIKDYLMLWPFKYKALAVTTMRKR